MYAGPVGNGVKRSVGAAVRSGAPKIFVAASETPAASGAGCPHWRQNLVPGIISAPHRVQARLDISETIRRAKRKSKTRRGDRGDAATRREEDKLFALIFFFRRVSASPRSPRHLHIHPLLHPIARHVAPERKAAPGVETRVVALYLFVFGCATIVVHASVFGAHP